MIASQLALVQLTCGLRMLHVDLGMELGIQFFKSELKYYMFETTILFGDAKLIPFVYLIGIALGV